MGGTIQYRIVEIFAGANFRRKQSWLFRRNFRVFFMECRTLWPHPYQLMRHLRIISYGFVGILYGRRLILLCSNHSDGRQTVENHLVHIGTQCTHVMTSSTFILVHFFMAFIFMEAGLSAKITKICTHLRHIAVIFHINVFYCMTKIWSLYLNFVVYVARYVSYRPSCCLTPLQKVMIVIKPPKMLI